MRHDAQPAKGGIARLDPALVQFYDGASERQAQAASALGSASGQIGPEEGLEERRASVDRN